MPKLKKILNDLYENSELPSSYDRRLALISEMNMLESKAIHCFTCPGTCCTSQANSMQITPIEALEILHSLKIDEFDKEKIDSFKELMKKTISMYRLDVEVYTGKKNSSPLRKSYTCPFFNNGSLGCGLSRAVKPYGCLGFNPKINDDNGKSCSSNTEVLEKREHLFQTKENLVNAQIRKELNLPWIKQNIPQALIDIVTNL